MQKVSSTVPSADLFVRLIVRRFMLPHGLLRIAALHVSAL